MRVGVLPPLTVPAHARFRCGIGTVVDGRSFARAQESRAAGERTQSAHPTQENEAFPSFELGLEKRPKFPKA
jgi:hypothetical protein